MVAVHQLASSRGLNAFREHEVNDKRAPGVRGRRRARFLAFEEIRFSRRAQMRRRFIRAFAASCSIQALGKAQIRLFLSLSRGAKRKCESVIESH